jgi:hypothetical protein
MSVMPIPPLPVNTDLGGQIFGLLILIVAFSGANLAAQYLLHTNYSLSLTADAKKLRGMLGVLASVIGIFVAGLNESSWLVLPVFIGIVSFIYAANADDEAE